MKEVTFYIAEKEEGRVIDLEYYTDLLCNMVELVQGIVGLIC